MRRREFIAYLVGIVPFSILASAQDRMRHVGILSGVANDSEGQARSLAFRQGLQALGWIEGRNLRIDERWASGSTQQVDAYTAELVGLRPDVLLATGARASVALQRETRTIPIVTIGMPVALLSNLARPVGNATGFSLFDSPLVGKLLESLKETMPHIRHAALLIHPDHPNLSAYTAAFESAAISLEVRPRIAIVRDRDQIENAVRDVASSPNGGLVIPADVFLTANRELVLSLASLNRLPCVSNNPAFVGLGGLLSYGPDIPDLYRRAAAYVDRILKGEKPSNLPVQTPTKYQLVINLKSAKSFGLTVPTSLLARADEVIE